MTLILDLAAEHVPATLLRQQRLARLVGDRILDVDLPAGRASFGEDLDFPMQLVGSVANTTKTFTWAWSAPDAAPPEVLRCVTALRDYGLKHELDELSQAVWHTEDVDPFLLASIARGWCQADALYRAPLPDGAVYLLLGQVSLPPPEPHQVVQALTTGIALAPMDHRMATMGLLADAQVSVTGLDEMVVATVGQALVNIVFTPQGRIDDVSVSHL
ncbi:MAG: DUF6882 domain-containing protein [Euzebya sp.]